MLSLNGCSLWQAPQTTTDETQIQGQKLLSHYWTLKAKIGIKTQKENGSAGLLWQQMGSEYKITLTGPLGKQLGKLESDGLEIMLTSADGTTQTASTEDELVLNIIGKPLPVTQLQFWIKGMKAPFFPIEPISSSEKHLEFIQKNWRVSMENLSVINGYQLPQRLVLTYPASGSSSETTTLELKVIVKDWNIQSDATAIEAL